MYCPNCRREVGTKRVFDGTHIGVSGLIAVIILVLLSSVGLVITTPVVFLAVALQCWSTSPRICPFCRTRLLNSLVGDEKAVYASEADAKQGIISRMYCNGCRTEYPKGASYCPKCGKNLTVSTDRAGP